MGWAIFDVFKMLLEKLPIQDRKERIKNRIEDLRKERVKLQKEPASVKTSKRITDIDISIPECEQLLRNIS